MAVLVAWAFIFLLVTGHGARRHGLVGRGMAGIGFSLLFLLRTTHVEGAGVFCSSLLKDLGEGEREGRKQAWLTNSLDMN